MIERLRAWWRRLQALQGFRGSVLTLLTGSSATLGLVYLAQPILTRLYTPEAFGTLDFLVTLTGVVAVVASLRYEDALMLPADEDDAGRLFWLALLLSLATTLLSTLLVVWRADVAALFGQPALAPWLWLVPPVLLFLRGARLLELWLVRLRRFPTVSGAQVVQTATMLTTRLGAGVPPLQMGAGGLIGGLLTGHLASLLFYLRALRRVPRPRWPRQIARLRTPAVRYRRFALFSTPSTLLNTLVTRLPVLLLLYFFDEAVVGLYGRAFVTLTVPLSLIGGAVSQVFFVHAAEARHTGTLPAMAGTVHARLVLIGLFPTLVLLIAGPDLFAFVFGPAWRTAGTYVQFVGPWLFLASIAAPLTRLFDVLERQRTELATSLILFAVQTTALILGGQTGRVETALLFLGMGGALARLLHLAILLWIGNVDIRAAVTPYVRYTALALPFLLLIVLCGAAGRPWLTAAAAAGAGLGYAGLVAWRDGLLPGR